jgi:hypothetical protein
MWGAPRRFTKGPFCNVGTTSKFQMTTPKTTTAEASPINEEYERDRERHAARTQENQSLPCLKSKHQISSPRPVWPVHKPRGARWFRLLGLLRIKAPETKPNVSVYRSEPSARGTPRRRRG